VFEPKAPSGTLWDSKKKTISRRTDKWVFLKNPSVLSGAAVSVKIDITSLVPVYPG
jgi:hypothetical protein